MAWRIRGTYVESCSCKAICACPVDGPPSAPDGGTECRGVGVFRVIEGNSDATDLSGLGFALYTYWPSRLSQGNWKIGLVVDERASEEQAEALERILSGQEGGTFAELAPLIGENLGVERGAITVSDEDRPGASVAGKTDVTFEPYQGLDGRPVTVKNAAYAYSPEYQVGTTTGRSSGFGLEFDPSYGDHGSFDFASEGEAAVRGRG